MASRQELARLREAANRAMRLNRRKQNRLRRDFGAHDLGKHAPRVVSRDQINRYTARQLETLIENSENFRSRRTQFVGSAYGQAIPRKKWRAFDDQQRKRQAQQRQALSEIDDVYIDSLNQTIGERRAMVSPPRARQLENNMWLEDKLKEPSNFPTEQGLERMTERLMEANAGTEQSRARRKAMESLDQMFPYMEDADPQLLRDIKNLDDNQFYALWNIRDFAQEITAWYVNAKARLSPEMSATKSATLEGMANDYRGSIRGLVEGVQKIDRIGGRL